MLRICAFMDNSMFHKIEKCRVCGNEHYSTVLDLGNQYLSGIFPKFVDLDVYRGPLKLVKCDELTGGCGHVQLEHTFHLPTMYGDEYGYRSGLNGSMVKHLKSKYEKISNFLDLKENDIVIDIAGNDGTFLGFFSPKLKLVSIDLKELLIWLLALLRAVPAVGSIYVFESTKAIFLYSYYCYHNICCTISSIFTTTAFRVK